MFPHERMSANAYELKTSVEIQYKECQSVIINPIKQNKSKGSYILPFVF